MNKKIIPSLLLTLLLIPAITMAQSNGGVNLEEEVAIISVPSWLKASLFTWNAEGKYKVTMSNTGLLDIYPELHLYVFQKGVACPTGDIGTFLTTYASKADINWKVKITGPDGAILADYASGHVYWSAVGIGKLAPGSSVIWYGYAKSPAGGDLGDYCFLARYRDANIGAELDYKTDVITVTTPGGKITLEFLGLVVIGMSAILISKGMALW